MNGNPRELTVSDVIDNQPVSRLQYRTIGLCGLVAVLDGFDTQSIGLLAPAIAGALDVSLSSFAPVFVAGLLGLMLGAALLGPIADHWGRRWTIIASTFVFGLFSFLTGYATSFDMLLVLRFITGIGLGGAMPNVVALTAEYAPKRLQAIFISMLFAGMPLGAVLGGLVASFLLPLYGWQSVFFVGGILPLATVIVLVFMLPESPCYLIARGNRSDQAAAIIARIAPSFRDRTDLRLVPEGTPLKGSTVKHLFTEGRMLGTLLLWVPYFMNLLIIYFVVSWLPAVLTQAGMPISAGVTAISLFSLGGIVGSLGQGVVMQKFSASRVLTAEFGFAVVIIGSLAVLPPSFALIMSVAVVLGVLVQGAQAGLNALVAGFYPTAIRSTGVGWALGVGRIGSIIGPILGGVMLSLNWDIQQIFLAGTLPPLCAGMAILAGSYLRRSAADSAPSRRSANPSSSASSSGSIHPSQTGSPPDAFRASAQRTPAVGG